MKNVRKKHDALKKHCAVSIIIVSYNTRHLTVEAIQSARQNTSLPIEIIVVDNASTDGSVSKIRAAFPDLNVVEMTENIGFGGANNIAAREASGKYLLLLNSDTIVLPGAIDALVAFAEDHPAAGIWGGRTLFSDGSLNPTSCWRRMSLWSIFCRSVGLSTLMPWSGLTNPEAYPGWQRDTVGRVDIVTGCFLLIGRDLWENLAGFDRAFFLYGEEVDLCLRARRFGADPLITPKATIIHLVGASQPGTTNRTIQIQAARLRNVLLHFPVWQKPFAVTLTRAGVIGRWVIFTCLARLAPQYAARRAAWREILARRQEWWWGYRDLGHNKTPDGH